ncbi:hypothetical protein [Tissierella praeacuta]|uniref:hypothetical protein n=1 Tax=Tissierella praeacuta TaxID=43131 RepID=UPI0028AB97E3|nr:hypothetical protein [Tissierella praeacuta]
MAYIPVKLDKTRNLLFGFGALQMFKSIHGESLMKVDFINDDLEDIIPLMFYVGLRHEDSELTLERTTELIDLHLGVQGVIEIMPEIMKQLRPKVGEEPKNDQKAAGKKK